MCERASEICTRAARGARVFIKLAEKREMRKGEKRKNESGEHAGNRLGECMGNGSGEYAVARGRANGMIGQTSIWKVGGKMDET